MRPGLALVPAQLHGFLKVNATLGGAALRLSSFNDEMPCLQIEEAGIVIELEFTDREGLEDFSRQLQALVPTSAEALNG